MKNMNPSNCYPSRKGMGARMLIALLAALMWLPLTAQDTASAAYTPVTYTFLLLKDGTKIAGKVIRKDEQQLVVSDFVLGELTIERSQVITENELATGTSWCFFVTGQQLCGEVISQDDSLIYIKTESIAMLRLDPKKIKEVKPAGTRTVVNGEVWFPNPHPTRYLFMPSAIPIKKGEGYYQNIWLLGNTVNYGITNHFSLGGGIGFPLCYMISAKAGYKVAKNVHVAGGGVFAGAFYGINFGLGAAYGAVTIGNDDNNFTLAGGYGLTRQLVSSGAFTSNYEWKPTPRPMFTASGMVRLANHFSLVTENWFFATQEHLNNSSMESFYTYHAIASLGFRTMWQRSSFDLAAVRIGNTDTSLVIPYIDYVFKF